MTTITLQELKASVTLSIKELKDYCQRHEIQVEGDKRKKISYVEAITDFLIECGEQESIAYQADIDSGTITYDATDFCPLTCEVKIKSFCFVDDEVHTVEPNNTDNLTEQAELEAVEPETVNVISNNTPALNRKFESGGSVMFLLTPVALMIAGMIMAGIWVISSFSAVLISLVKYLLPLVDKGLTSVLLGAVAIVELIFGSDYDEYADSYLEIKHLLR